MTNNKRIFNITRKFSLKRSQALKAIENGACAWVIQNESIRDCTLAESIAHRNQQAAERDPLPLSELHGLTFKAPPAQLAAAQQELRLARQANQFFSEMVH